MDDGFGIRRSAAVAWQVWRAEGAAAFRDRGLDRLAAWRRRRSFRLVAEDRLRAAVPVLNVMPTPPRPDLGGVQVQFLRRLAAEARPSALLYPEPGGYRLEVEAAGERRAATLPARRPAFLELADEGFEKAVRHAAERLGARALHVEQPVGLPLASLLRLRRSGLRLVLSLHDFGLFCPRPHLLEHPGLTFCHYCRDDARCAACLRRDWPVDDGFQAARRALAAELLAAADAVVYPSDFLRRKVRELLPVPATGQWVIPPAAAAAAVPPPVVRPGRVQHVAFAGSVQAHKGALLFEELVGRFPELTWSVFGGGDPEILARLRRLPRVAVRGYYRSGSLAGLLRRRRVDLVLLLSIVPESYGLTLDETLSVGVPVIAFDHGAVAERTRALGGGVLIRPEAGVEGIERGLREVLRDPGRLVVPDDVSSRLPKSESAARQTRDVYRSLGVAR